MIVPMGSSDAPPQRELVQRLYKKNIELENGLRKSAQSKIPSDPNVWLQMRENYEAIILEDHEFSERHEVGYALWQLHYKRIEEFRAHMNAAPAATGSVTSQGGKVLPRPDRIKKIRSIFKSFLSEATGFYHDLILKIRAKYGLPLGYFSEGSENQIILAKDGKKSAEMKKGLMSCHRCLIYLGDLARYKGLYGEGDSASRDYTAASSYYIQAASLWPSSGNPHHQLAILASYSGDDLMAVYRYFRSLAMDNPFSTARDNLIIVFEKNRQSCSQLPSNAKASSAKTVPEQMNGRGRGDSRVLTKDVKTEVIPGEERELSIPEILKAFSTRFVRLNGILFTRTSLETFQEIFSLVISDLHELLSSGPEEELNFGPDAADNGLVIVRLVTIIIFTVHNVYRESEGQSYAEILQRSVLLQNAFTAAFEFVGHIIKRCIQLHNASSSYLLPAILVFIEWLACCPDIASGVDVEEKQAAARSFFWSQCISFMNKLLISGLVSVDGNEDESCFFDMSRYDECETGNWLALWEDFELRGFSPLAPAHLILDFSFGSDGSNREKKVRMQRILAAGKALMNVVQVDHQGIYFDPKLKKFIIGNEAQTYEDDTRISFFEISKENGVGQGAPIENTANRGVILSDAKSYLEVGEEEDEVIVFKPTVAEKYPSVPKSAAYEIIQSVQNSTEGDWANYVDTFDVPLNKQPLTAVNASSQLHTTSANIIQQSVHHISPSTSKWFLEQDSFFSDGLKKLNLVENGLRTRSGLQEYLAALQLSHPFTVPANSANKMLSSQMKVAEAVVPSKFDSIIPSGVNSGGLAAKLSATTLCPNPRKNPVSRPIRHSGPPPGFSLVPPKQPDDSNSNLVLTDQQPPVDDYSWLDGYQSPSTKVPDAGNSLGHTVQSAYLHAATGNGNSLTGAMSFPFPGKQIPAMPAEVENDKRSHDYQLIDHLKLYSEQQFQLGNQQTAPPQEKYQAQPLWPNRYYV